MRYKFFTNKAGHRVVVASVKMANGAWLQTLPFEIEGGPSEVLSAVERAHNTIRAKLQKSPRKSELKGSTSGNKK